MTSLSLHYCYSVLTGASVASCTDTLQLLLTTTTSYIPLPSLLLLLLQQIIRLEDSTKGLEKGDDVLAVFPDTTSFYKARVHKVNRLGAGSNYPSNSYSNGGNDGGSSGSDRGTSKKDQPLEVSHLFNCCCATVNQRFLCFLCVLFLHCQIKHW
jgi:SGF29 tudor-like domain